MNFKKTITAMGTAIVMSISMMGLMQVLHHTIYTIQLAQQGMLHLKILQCHQQELGKLQ